MDNVARALALKALKSIQESKGNEAVITASNTSGFISQTITLGNDCNVSFTWSSIENGLATGNGTLKITVNNAVKKTMSIAQGDVDLNLKDYISAGGNVIKLIINDVYDNSKTLTFTINAIELLVTSNFDSTAVYTGAINFTYTPIGELVKTMHFVLDDVELGTEDIETSNRQQTYVIPAQSHGSHRLEVYYTATINDTEVESNRLIYDLICIEAGNDTPIIVSDFSETEVKQRNTILIGYTVYTPNIFSSEIELFANDVSVATLTVDRSRQVWSYQAQELGELILSIVCGDTTKEFNLTVIENDINIHPETNDLELYLSAIGRSNSEEHPEIWSYEDIEAELTDFNFVSDGWQRDEDSLPILKIAGDARVEIPFKIFEEDFRTTGKTIEIEFSTTDIVDYDTTILSCMSGGRGLQLTPQKASFDSEQASISTQYKEDEHVRISFVIEKRVENRLIYCYINGIMSGIVQYPDDNDFSQVTPVNITIGSNDCTTNIYCIRIYSNDLSRYQIVDNWIADTLDTSLQMERYIENNIYDAYGNIVIDKLPSKLPYLVLEGPSLPQYKGNKLSIDGYYVNPMDDSKSFTFTGATIDVQGTSSQYYARKNYKIKFKNFTMTSTGETTTKYALRNGAIPVNTFTFKADVASSEGCNNVELVRLYNSICPYQTPPQEEDSTIRQGIDGFPIVTFWNNGETTTFLGKYNFNNDKGTEDTYGFTEGDESWETLDNTLDVTQFKSVPTLSNRAAWLNGFEARYPDVGDEADLTRLHALATWINSTDTTAATDALLDESVTYEGVTYTNDTEEYRLAKFKNELEDWLDKDDTIFYYVFTELFLLIDSRVKNSFPTKFGDNAWCWLPYDMDTAIGINNEGTLAFDYAQEDTDQTASGADVYNGQDSVIWNNVRMAFQDEIKSMYQELRSGLLSYDTIESQFEQHQSYWSASIFNEDAYFKYIQPLIEDNEDYLLMCQGSKAEQRKWWLFNRFRYLDSKYTTGDAQSNYINFRAYANSDFYITPYADIYIRVKCGSYEASARAQKNQEYHLALDRENANDTETMIYSADQLKDVGDLSGFKVGFCNIAAATRLEHLKIGSEEEENLNLTNLTLGNNKLLKTLDVRNCPNLLQTVNASGCENIEEIYFEGSGIRGLTLPNGGVLKTLHLPDTITNLTIRNQQAITDFQLDDSSNITTLRLENVSSAVPVIDIFNGLDEGSRVRLIGLNLTFDNIHDLDEFLNRLDTMRGLDENGGNVNTAQVQGIINIEDISDTALNKIQTKYTNLTVNYTSVWYIVNFYNDVGTLLQTKQVRKNETVSFTGSTTKTATAQYTYTFSGWSTELGGEIIATTEFNEMLASVKNSVNFYQNYTATLRSYQVVIQTMNYQGYVNTFTTMNNVPYGTYINPPIGAYISYNTANQFSGWNINNLMVTGNMNFRALYEPIPSNTRAFLRNAHSLDPNVNVFPNVKTIDGFFANRALRNHTEVSFPDMTSLPYNPGQFVSNNLVYLYLNNVSSIQSYGLNLRNNALSLKYISLGDIKTLPNLAIYGVIEALNRPYLDLSRCTQIPNITNTSFYISYRTAGQGRFNCTAILPDNLYDTWISNVYWKSWGPYNFENTAIKASDYLNMQS